MKFDRVEKLDDKRFRLVTGVRCTPFNKMLQILQQAANAKKIKGVRKYKLTCFMYICSLLNLFNAPMV
ncbi:hypothetical protein NEOC95_001772 [Neochlamydia sp. AcF95]|nr:hypothetical protein [Neochlamydia sp. AcF95]